MSQKPLQIVILYVDIAGIVKDMTTPKTTPNAQHLASLRHHSHLASLRHHSHLTSLRHHSHLASLRHHSHLASLRHHSHLTSLRHHSHLASLRHHSHLPISSRLQHNVIMNWPSQLKQIPQNAYCQNIIIRMNILLNFLLCCYKSKVK